MLNFQHKIWHLLFSKSDEVYSFPVKNWHDENFSNQNHSFYESMKKAKFVIPTEKKKKTWSFYANFFEIRHVEKNSKQKLMRCKNFNSKPNTLYLFYFKSWCDVFPISSKFDMFWNRYFKSWPHEKVIFKIWCVVKFQFQNLMRFFPWIQNLTRCIFLYSKSDMSEYYISECNALFFTSISNTLYCIFLKSDAMSFPSVQKLTCGKILNQNHSFQKITKVAESVVFTEKKKQMWFVSANSFEIRHIKIF